jgi:hypothetical protein
MLQAAVCYDCTRDASTLDEDCFGPAEVDVGRGEIVQALVITDVVVVLDEGVDLLFDEVCGEWQVSIRKACDAFEFDRSTKLQISSLRPGCPRTTDQGDLPCARSLRLRPRSRPASPRRLGN